MAGSARWTDWNADPAKTVALVVGVEAFEGLPRARGSVGAALDYATWLAEHIPPASIWLALSPAAEPQDFVQRGLQGARMLEPVRSSIESLLADGDAAWLQAELMMFYWAGHGLRDVGLGRRLFYREARKTHKANLSFKSLQARFSDATFPVPHTIGVVDACAVDGRDFMIGLPNGDLTVGPQRQAGQLKNFYLFSTRGNEAAEAADAGDTTVFTPRLLDELRGSEPQWPPDFEQATQALVEVFEARRADPKHQASQAPCSIDEYAFGSERIVFENRLLGESEYVAALAQLLDEELREIDSRRFSYNMQHGSGEGASVREADELAADVIGKGSAVLRGGGGTGKSVQLRFAARTVLNHPEFTPVFVHAARFSPGHLDFVLENPANLDAVEILLNQAIAPRGTAPAILDLRNDDRNLFLFVDGLNECVNDTRGAGAEQQLFNQIALYVSRTPGDRCLVTSRTRLTAERFGWRTFEMQPIGDASLAETLSQALHTPLESLDAKLIEILRTPFFLKMALEKGGVDFGTLSRAGIIRDFFQRLQNGLFLKPDELDRLAEAAFEVYRTGGTSFPLRAIVEPLGRNAHQILHSTLIDEDGVLRFDHQLKHDFLVAWRMVSGGENRSRKWTPGDLDVATFHTENRDPLTMAVELMREFSGADNDAFLRAVYNWHLPRSLDCLRADSSDDGDSVFSRELRIATLALLSGKQCDPLLHTFQSYLVQCRTLRDRQTYLRLFLMKPAQLQEEVRTIESDVPWFQHWRDLYCEKSEAIETSLYEICGEDSILAWTVANVLRNHASPEDIGYLCGRLEGDGTLDEIARWRIAHVLGAHPESKYARDVLERKLRDPTEYVWVRYGSGRSLMEMAATATDTGTRQDILQQTLAAIQSPEFHGDGSGPLDANGVRIIREVGRSTLYRNAPEPDDWIRLASPVVDYVESQLEHSAYRDEWLLEVRQPFEDGGWIRGAWEPLA